jgi:hypothetical protein
MKTLYICHELLAKPAIRAYRQRLNYRSMPEEA